MTNQNSNGIQTGRPNAMPSHDAKELMNGAQKVNIRLGENLYTLRITRTDKLLLTK
ncbi:hemin uptake protein HemP [Rhodobacteraceae bacterium LMO-12]|nr:hemin uptake protein HemP [Rhodobacteraceae bacterium LMO-JJ12]